MDVLSGRNLLATLDNYDATAHYLSQLDLSQEELRRSIIGAIGDVDAYQLPDAKGYTSLSRYLAGETEEDLQLWREQILGTTAKDFRDLSAALEKLNQAGLIVVLGSQEALAKANAEQAIGWRLRKFCKGKKAIRCLVRELSEIDENQPGNVNDVRHEVEAAPGDSLLELLRRLGFYRRQARL